MTKRMLIMLGCVLALIVALGVGFFLHIQKLIASAPKPGPQTVTTAVAKMQEWQPQLSAVGTLTAVHGVDISSEVAGQVRSLHFKSGQDVKAGDVLVQLNADADQAQLRSLQAAAELAATTLKRDRAQLAIDGVSQAQVDADTADLKSKTALVAQQAAQVAKKTIRAPFAGRLGITAVNPGQYLNPGDKIVTLQTIDPVYVDFTLPQRQIGQVRVGQPVSVASDAFGKEAFKGKINAINPKVDPTTRNVQVEATIANPKRKLLPGMFATAAIDIGAKQRHLTLPQTAITYNPYGSTVFIVKQGKNGPEAQQAFVTTGDTRGDQVAITGGLKEGQEVVTSGQLKLKTGTPVTVNNSVRPANDPNPTPQEH
ncbi:efflux RND transporter periplasmic adaptor subunit [Chromobacterium paludis]|uniref:Efflux RND transporter periplasmic adaptor subunit n=1 Tax=Chromobacterium paludis TaxID=2605945 RepID=A0A5C1DD55_9NEIS|nr:efflux RND transporter periplasmic adaptor subunit [Chromobacterium paludis]QEL54654.1 efflux RND transporter periplasmic adaptor subunit [Chromobacterium paludis]